MRNLWDHAWEQPAPDLFVQFDVDDASYTGAARQPASFYQALRDRAINVLGIMETTSTASQGGYNVGMQFVQFARSRWREVGFPDSAPMAYAMSDGSSYDPNYGWGNIAACGEGVGDYEVGPYVFYGNRYAVDAACEGAARSMHPELCLNLHGGWIPRTWNFDPSRDSIAQEVGSTPVGGIDVNTVYRPLFGGAAPTPVPPTLPKGTAMLVLAKGDGMFVKNNEFWVFGPGSAARKVTGTLQEVLDTWGHLPTLVLPVEVPDTWVAVGITEYVRGRKLDKQLANVTLP